MKGVHSVRFCCGARTDAGFFFGLSLSVASLRAAQRGAHPLVAMPIILRYAPQMSIKAKVPQLRVMPQHRPVRNRLSTDLLGEPSATCVDRTDVDWSTSRLAGRSGSVA